MLLPWWCTLVSPPVVWQTKLAGVSWENPFAGDTFLPGWNYGGGSKVHNHGNLFSFEIDDLILIITLECHCQFFCLSDRCRASWATWTNLECGSRGRIFNSNEIFIYWEKTSWNRRTITFLDLKITTSFWIREPCKKWCYRICFSCFGDEMWCPKMCLTIHSLHSEIV